MWVRLESGLQAAEVIFLDRALPDSLTFYRFAGLNPNIILPDCFQHHYASVFILNRLPYQRDGVRAGDDAAAAYYDSWTSRDYSALGYNVVRVPVLPPKERLVFILERLPERGLI
jgi:predicted ATPase